MGAGASTHPDAVAARYRIEALETQVAALCAALGHDAAIPSPTDTGAPAAKGSKTDGSGRDRSTDDNDVKADGGDAGRSVTVVGGAGGGRRLSTTIETNEADVREEDDGTLTQVNQYRIQEELGRGAYGVVHRCTSAPDGRVFAVKIMNKSLLKRKRVGRRGNALQNVAKEVAVWKKLDHGNCVHLDEVVDDPDHDHVYLFGEFVNGGCILPDKAVVDPIPEDEARHIFAQALDGLRYLHFERVAHRDIKPGNILTTKGGVVKLADFGVAHAFEDDDSGEVRNSAGTAMFFAPEMTTGGSFKAMPLDVWAMGVTLYLMLFGRVPFDAPTLPKLYEAIQKDDPKFHDSPPTSEGAREIIRKMLNKDPGKRPTVEELARDDWLKPVADTDLHALPSVPFEVTEEEIAHAISPLTTKIGNLVRAHVGFTRVLYATEDHAATAINKTARGYIGRKRVRKIRAEREAIAKTAATG